MDGEGSGEGTTVRLFDEIADALSDAQTPRALERTLALICDALEMETGWIWLVDPQTDRFYLAASHRLPPFLLEPVQMTGDPCWCMESFYDGDFVTKNVDVIACSRLRSGAPEATRGIRYHASVALRFGAKQLGILNLTGPQFRPLGEGELHVLGTIGAQIGLAVERARLAEEASSLARSEERARLAREIHDTLAQDLTAITLQLERAQRHAGDPGDLERLATALEVTRAALARARESVLALRSDPLDGKPLAAALAGLARRFISETGIRLSVETDDVPLPYETEVALFRIASEALTNIVRHANAHTAELRLSVDERGVRLGIVDDGSGFDPNARPGGRYGLVGMEERARDLGGTLEVTTDGSGTSIEVVIPRRPS